MELQQEKDLIARARRLDTEAVGRLYDEYFDEILGYIIRRTGDDQAGYDIAADVFMKAFRWLGSFQWKGILFRAYVYRIASNAIVDFYRNADKQHVVTLSDVEAQCSVQDEAPMVETQCIASLLNELKKIYSHVLVLRYWQDKSVRETAEIIGKSEWATKTIIHRALESARKLAPRYSLDESIFPRNSY